MEGKKFVEDIAPRYWNIRGKSEPLEMCINANGFNEVRW
jgi:hypothetical protein